MCGFSKASCFCCPQEVAVIMAKLFETIGKFGLALAIGGGVVNSALFNGELALGLFQFTVFFIKAVSLCYTLVFKLL